MSNVKHSGWLLLLFVLSGIVIGGMVSEFTDGIVWLRWLGYGNTFGINDSENPFVLDLGIIAIKCAIQIKLTVASIIGVLIAIYAFRKI